MFKSAVLFSKALLVFHIFAEDGLQQEFKERVCSLWNDVKLQIFESRCKKHTCHNLWTEICEITKIFIK